MNSPMFSQESLPIGNTPLIHLKALSELVERNIFGKAEFLNPGGSVKDRAVLGMLKEAWNSRKIQSGSTVIEATAGNTGIALAMLGNRLGLKVKLTMPDNLASEKYSTLRLFGAELFLKPPCPFTDDQHFYHRARIMSESISGSFWLDQFENENNWKFHYQTTGPEIFNSMQGKVDGLVLAAGTGGTISGISKYLKDQHCKVRVVLADPMDSGLSHYVECGVFQSPGKSLLEGIGIGRLVNNFKNAHVDECIRVSDFEALSMCDFLVKKEGFWLGSSAGLNVFAAAKASLKFPKGSNIVTVLCDVGSRYLTKHYNSEWRKSNGYENLERIEKYLGF